MKKLAIYQGLMVYFIFSLFASTAHAHGAVIFPIARQYQCYKDIQQKWPSSPADLSNPGCRAAFEQSGAYPFQQWNEVSVNVPNWNDMSAVQRMVPDGTLCSAGDPNKRGLDAPQSAGWVKTEIRPEQGKLDLVWDLTQPHNPSFLTAFITKPGYNPGRPLRWSDLELIYKGNMPAPIGSYPKQYRVTVPIPTGRVGDAIIYTIWQRDDPVGEGFYNCSDVTIEGRGNQPTFPWIEEKQFVPVEIAPKIGDGVRFRVMGVGTRGLEAVDVTLPITAQNIDARVWPQALADLLNREHAAFVQIGLRRGDNISYDPLDPQANKVWLRQPNYSSYIALVAAVEPPPPNPDPGVAPVAKISGPESIKSGDSATFSAENSSGSHLKYHWEAYDFDPHQGDASNIWLTAESFDATTHGLVVLDVTDDRGRTSEAELHVRIDPKQVTPPNPDPEALPVARIDGPATIRSGRTVTYSAAKSTGRYLNYHWKMSGMFPEQGDGQSISVIAPPSPQTPSGTVRLVVTDDAGVSSSAALLVAIETPLVPPDPSIPAYVPNKSNPPYKVGDKVWNYGHVFECKRGASAGNCGDYNHEPLRGEFWTDVWTFLE